MSEETHEEFLERMRSISYIGKRSGNRVETKRLPDGGLVKATTDELNNTVINRGSIDNERQDVIVRPNGIAPIAANSRKEPSDAPEA